MFWAPLKRWDSREFTDTRNIKNNAIDGDLEDNLIDI